MNVVALDIADVKLFTPKRFGDNRGFFSEVYSSRAFEAAGIGAEFVQDNHSLSADVGTIRGLHFQTPPYAQTKLVRVIRGRIFDVVVDLRRASKTFGQHVSAELSADNWSQLLVPIGFAHGFCTLEPNTEVLYKVDSYYAPAHDAGLLWSDADLGILWPVDVSQVRLSDKDSRLPLLRDFNSPF
jgi:dTDP-4-dehydrorhamnose 3,5-epimerase